MRPDLDVDETAKRINNYIRQNFVNEYILINKRKEQRERKERELNKKLDELNTKCDAIRDKLSEYNFDTEVIENVDVEPYVKTVYEGGEKNYPKLLCTATLTKNASKNIDLTKSYENKNGKNFHSINERNLRNIDKTGQKTFGFYVPVDLDINKAVDMIENKINKDCIEPCKEAYRKYIYDVNRTQLHHFIDGLIRYWRTNKNIPIEKLEGNEWLKTVRTHKCTDLQKIDFNGNNLGEWHLTEDDIKNKTYQYVFIRFNNTGKDLLFCCDIEPTPYGLLENSQLRNMALTIQEQIREEYSKQQKAKARPKPEKPERELPEIDTSDNSQDKNKTDDCGFNT